MERGSYFPFGLVIAVAFPVTEQGLQACRQASVVSEQGISCSGPWTLEHGLCSCGTRTYWPHGMWDLPGAGIELVSPALVSRFLTAGLPAKPPLFLGLKRCTIESILVNLRLKALGWRCWPRPESCDGERAPGMCVDFILCEFLPLPDLLSPNLLIFSFPGPWSIRQVFCHCPYTAWAVYTRSG